MDLAHDGRFLPRDPELQSQMSGLIKEMADGRHLLEKALADLVAAYQRHPYPALAGTIEVVRAEIESVGTVIDHDEDT
jgi:hypothetical protein